MHDVQLDDTAVRDARALVDTIATRYESVEQERFLRDAPVLAHELPRALRQALSAFRRSAAAGACRVSGFPVDDVAIGGTPDGRDGPREGSPALRQEIFLVLCASLIGDPVGRPAEQDGHVVHDLVPVRETARRGSAGEAADPPGADYVALMCLRNGDGVPTALASLEDVGLRTQTRELLFEPRFRDRHDREPVGVLFGDAASPSLRIDPRHAEEPGGEDARAALRELIDAIDRQMTQVVLRPGELLLLDTQRAVHDPQPFRPRFDGTDRWLKRLDLVRDLRTSRDARARGGARVSL